jgi:hypothetical protein
MPRVPATRKGGRRHHSQGVAPAASADASPRAKASLLPDVRLPGRLLRARRGFSPRRRARPGLPEGARRQSDRVLLLRRDGGRYPLRARVHRPLDRLRTDNGTRPSGSLCLRGTEPAGIVLPRQRRLRHDRSNGACASPCLALAGEAVPQREHGTDGTSDHFPARLRPARAHDRGKPLVRHGLHAGRLLLRALGALGVLPVLASLAAFASSALPFPFGIAT